MDPEPKYQAEVLILGRPGIRAWRELNPRKGSADLIRATHHGLQLKFLVVVSAHRGVNSLLGAAGS